MKVLTVRTILCCALLCSNTLIDAYGLSQKSTITNKNGKQAMSGKKVKGTTGAAQNRISSGDKSLLKKKQPVEVTVKRHVKPDNKVVLEINELQRMYQKLSEEKVGKTELSRKQKLLQHIERQIQLRQRKQVKQQMLSQQQQQQSQQKQVEQQMLSQQQQQQQSQQKQVEQQMLSQKQQSQQKQVEQQLLQQQQQQQQNKQVEQRLLQQQQTQVEQRLLQQQQQQKQVEQRLLQQQQQQQQQKQVEKRLQQQSQQMQVEQQLLQQQQQQHQKQVGQQQQLFQPKPVHQVFNPEQYVSLNSGQQREGTLPNINQRAVQNYQQQILGPQNQQAPISVLNSHVLPNSRFQSQAIIPQSPIQQFIQRQPVQLIDSQPVTRQLVQGMSPQQHILVPLSALSSGQLLNGQSVLSDKLVLVNSLVKNEAQAGPKAAQQKQPTKSPTTTMATTQATTKTTTPPPTTPSVTEVETTTPMDPETMKQTLLERSLKKQALEIRKLQLEIRALQRQDRTNLPEEEDGPQTRRFGHRPMAFPFFR